MQRDNLARQGCSVPIEKVEISFPLKRNKINPSIKRTQTPVMLSWTCAVHKFKGISLDMGPNSFNLQRQKSFNQGQIDVALKSYCHLPKKFVLFDSIKVL